jgi:hypothetical protein
VTPHSTLEELAARIEAMKPADQLRLCAGLLEDAPGDLSVLRIVRPIVERIANEVGALIVVLEEARKR